MNYLAKKYTGISHRSAFLMDIQNFKKTRPVTKNYTGISDRSVFLMDIQNFKKTRPVTKNYTGISDRSVFLMDVHNFKRNILRELNNKGTILILRPDLLDDIFI